MCQLKLPSYYNSITLGTAVGKLFCQCHKYPVGSAKHGRIRDPQKRFRRSRTGFRERYREERKLQGKLDEKVKGKMLEGKALIEDTDMPVKMQIQAMACASQALDLYDVFDYKSIAAHIKKVLPFRFHRFCHLFKSVRQVRRESFGQLSVFSWFFSYLILNSGFPACVKI